MATTWHNGRVAFTCDPIFGLCVMSESGWFPVIDLTDEEFRLIIREWDQSPGNPFADELMAQQVERFPLI